MNIGSAINEIAELLESRDIAEPLREASLLVCLAIKKDRTFLIAHPEYELSSEEKLSLNGFVRRRANREPYQYISGKQEFFRLEFEVTPAVLIPRPETEILVERVIQILSKRIPSARFCEIGIGSGCIAISILHNIENGQAVGADVSEPALEVAARNSIKHKVDHRLELVISDVYSAVDRQDFDLIVSNPPYVPAGDIDSLQPEVRDFEPHIALTDGQAGLSIIKRIIDGAPNYLKPHGELLIEIGFEQSALVKDMFDPTLW